MYESTVMYLKKYGMPKHSCLKEPVKFWLPQSLFFAPNIINSDEW